jgi:hypothetical protein
MADEDDDELPITPVQSSSAYPVWANAARELMYELEQVPGSIEALERHQRALEFLETFQSWTPRSRPDNAQRVATIAAMMTFNSETREFLIRVRIKKPT